MGIVLRLIWNMIAIHKILGGHRIIQFHNIYFILRVFEYLYQDTSLQTFFKFGVLGTYFSKPSHASLKNIILRLACDGFEKYVPSTPNLKNVWKAIFLNGKKVLPKNGINNFPNYYILIFLKKKYKYIHYVSFLVKDIVLKKLALSIYLFKQNPPNLTMQTFMD